MRLKVKNEPLLFRDTTNKAIINTDVASYNKYKEAKNRIAIQQSMYDCQNNELHSLKNEIHEIKSAISVILEKLDSFNRKE